MSNVTADMVEAAAKSLSCLSDADWAELKERGGGDRFILSSWLALEAAEAVRDEG